MRHGKRNIKFGRHAAHRKATLISLVRNLVLYKRIETTLAKAKEAKRLADRVITWGKKGSLHHKRLAYSILGDRGLVAVLFNELAPLFANRQGGYTRVIHTRVRPGDNAQLAILEWTEKKEEVSDKKKAKKEESKAKPEKLKAAAEEKPKVEEKPAHREPKKEKQKPKGLLGGLRKFFNRKSPG